MSIAWGSVVNGHVNTSMLFEPSQGIDFKMLCNPDPIILDKSCQDIDSWSLPAMTAPERSKDIFGVDAVTNEPMSKLPHPSLGSMRMFNRIQSYLN